MKKKILGCVSLSLLCLGLSACAKHENPLTTVDEKEAGIFLLDASKSAEKQLGIYKKFGGAVYGQCMSKKENKDTCQKVYKAMVSFAEKTEGFNELTVSDLTDISVWKTLKDSYEEERFNSID